MAQITTCNEQHSTPDSIEVARLTVSAAEEIARARDPSPGYGLLVRYPVWQSFLKGLCPFMDNWKADLVTVAYLHGEDYGLAMRQAVRERDEVLDELGRSP